MFDKCNPQPTRLSKEGVEDIFAQYFAQVEAAPPFYPDCTAAPATGGSPATKAGLPPEDDALIDLSDEAPAAEAGVSSKVTKDPHPKGTLVEASDNATIVSDVIADGIFAKHFVSGESWFQVCMLIDVALGATVRMIHLMFTKSAVAFLPACVAVLPSAMAAPAAPLPSDVHFAATVAGILACSKWSWRSILGIPANDENPNYASSYRKLNLLIHPTKEHISASSSRVAVQVVIALT